MRGPIEGIELRPTGFKTLIEVLARGRITTIAECGYAMPKPADPPARKDSPLPSVRFDTRRCSHPDRGTQMFPAPNF
jgi:hypothetical protein